MSARRATIRCVAALVATVPLPGSAGAGPARIQVSVPEADVAISREVPGGSERLLYTEIGNPTGAALAGLELEYECGGRHHRRSILPVPAGGAWDTIWLPEPTPEVVTARLLEDREVAWSGQLPVPKVEQAQVVIPRSEPVRVSDLKPLVLRGTNYYPRWHPWPGIWREMSEQDFEAEFAELERLNINTIRTFYNLDTDAVLHRTDGTFTPELVSRIHTLLTVADRRHVKVMLCVGSAGAMDDFGVQQRFFRTGVEPFAHDGRVLMWDLINEPGGSEGPKATPELSRWIQVMYDELREVAPNHMLTVGLAWQFDQLWDLGVKPPVAQYHNYSGAVGVQPQGEPPVRNVADDLRGIAQLIDNRPLVIGEFGYATQVDEVRKDASEERQLEISRDVLTGAEAAVGSGVNLVGVYNWCAFHFGPDWMGKGEQSFGVIQLDGSLKPAGELLRDTYARWRARVKAPWED